MSCKKDHDIFNMFIKTFQKQFNFKVKSEENSFQRLSTWTVCLLNFALHLNENSNLMLSGFLIMNGKVENQNEMGISNLYLEHKISTSLQMQEHNGPFGPKFIQELQGVSKKLKIYTTRLYQFLKMFSDEAYIIVLHVCR